MDPVALATAATTFLIPYLTKFGEDFAKEAGKKLWDAIAERFKDKPGAAEAAKDLARDAHDPDNQEAFALQLRKTLKEDPEFFEEIGRLIQKAGPGSINNTQGIMATDGSTAVGEVRISGDMHGTFIVGSNNSVSQESSTSTDEAGRRRSKKRKG